MPLTSSSSISKDENASSIRAEDERTPLLNSVESGPSADPVDPSNQPHNATGDNNSETEKPLPALQIFLLCYTRVVEPIAFFSIFPYINSMIEKVGGIDKDEVGFYSGLIESLFSLTQMCVMVFWGKAADRYGRKPCLVFSLFGITITTTLFGMSQSLWQMILFRCLAGVFAGTLVTVRAMITENSTKETQARAFSYFAFAGNMGIFLGPLLGGALESPANKYTAIFGSSRFFVDYPYALPGFVTAFVGLSAAVLTALFVNETLHVHIDQSKSGAPKMSTWELLKYPGVAQVILIYNYVMMLAFAYTAVNPVFLYTPVKMGGIGFRPELIAAAIGLGGASQAIWLLFVYTPLSKRIGTGNILRICAIAWPFFFLVNPVCNAFLRHGLVVLFWIIGPFVTSVGTGVAMAFTACQLAVNDIAPSPETFGTLNALVLAFSSGLRAVMPAISTSIFASGVKYHILWGQLFWLVAIALAAGLTPILWLLPKKAIGQIQSEGADEEN